MLFMVHEMAQHSNFAMHPVLGNIDLPGAFLGAPSYVSTDISKLKRKLRDDSINFILARALHKKGGRNQYDLVQ